MDRPGRATVLERLIGRAPPFRSVLREVEALARHDATVLLTGESGTGKELVARAIHTLGPRAGGPFVAVNCGALPDSLLEDELFGHDRGAFTDARSARAGALSQAHRGTLLLDEVDALSPHGQVALLRVLQDRTFRPLGASAERLTDARFIAATNTVLAARVAEGSFRADLYYRLSVLTLDLPPLRARRADVLPLAEHFLRLHAPRDRPPARLAHDAVAALLAHDWPGNVRELENAILRALYRHDGPEIRAADLRLAASRRDGQPVPDEAGAPRTRVTRPLRAAKREVVDAFEREYLVELMAEHGGNVTQAARTAGKERRELGKLLKKHHLCARDFRSPPARAGAFAPGGVRAAVGALAPGPAFPSAPAER